MKIYRYLRTIWLLGAAALALSLLSVLQYYLNLSLGAVDLAMNVVSLALGAGTAWALRCIAEESARLHRAYICQGLNVGLSALSVVLSYVAGSSDAVAAFAMLLLMAASIFSIVSDFQLYWALDERVVAFGYAFPARRIRWCFYLPLIGVMLSSFAETSQMARAVAAGQTVDYLFSSTGTLALFVCQLGALVLLAQYIAAVGKFEIEN